MKPFINFVLILAALGSFIVIFFTPLIDWLVAMIFPKSPARIRADARKLAQAKTAAAKDLERKQRENESDRKALESIQFGTVIKKKTETNPTNTITHE